MQQVFKPLAELYLFERAFERERERESEVLKDLKQLVRTQAVFPPLFPLRLSCSAIVFPAQEKGKAIHGGYDLRIVSS